MSTAAHFRAAYGSALAGHLVERGESGLRAAYELGRDAVERRLSVLDLAAVHHDGLIAALRGCSDSREIEAIMRAAADFFLESLSAFEMIQRGFAEAREAAMLERRHAEVLRQLSNLLADASLALGASDSLGEMLQLVAEQARELTNARACVAIAAVGPTRAAIEAASYADADTWSDATQNVGAGELGADDAHEAHPSRLSAPLTALDGREFGSIELVDKPDGDFTELDEAILVHIAQMAAAALERARLYRPG
jgi:GAF domain-containing protein